MFLEFRMKSRREAVQLAGPKFAALNSYAAAQGTKSMPKTVLIVEDNELNMKLFHDLLQANGFDTIETRNGIEALDLARKHKPDLILMDIQEGGCEAYLSKPISVSKFLETVRHFVKQD